MLQKNDQTYFRKMKKYLISFATQNFRKMQKVLCKSAKGFDCILCFTEKDIDRNFKKQNSPILNQKKGAGYWLWKPYFILKTLEKMQEGDALVYLDSDYKFVKNIDNLLDVCKKNKGILLFYLKYPNKQWTKRDCFVIMNADSKKYWDSKHLEAGFQIYIRNKNSVHFVKKYLKYCKDKRVLTDLPNTFRKNLLGFSDHRHDQSVLSILATKYNVKTLPFKKYHVNGKNKNKNTLIIDQNYFGFLKIADFYIGKLGILLNKNFPRIYYAIRKVFKKK